MSLPFFQTVFEELDKCDYTDKVMGGDFNLVINENVDRTRCKESHLKAHAVLVHYMKTTKMSDLWRVLNPDKKEIYLAKSK